MGRKPNKPVTPAATGGENIRYSWLPEGMEAESVLASAGWKPAVGESRCIEVTGFQSRTGENGEYLIVTATDLQTGEPFAFVPGGLFAYLASEEGGSKIKTGDRLGLKYKGTKDLKDGFKANDWEIVKLKKPAIHPDAPAVER